MFRLVAILRLVDWLCVCMYACAYGNYSFFFAFALHVVSNRYVHMYANLYTFIAHAPSSGRVHNGVHVVLII